MLGLDRGEMLVAGLGQGYEDENAVNKPTEKIGQGIYSSPHFQVCFHYTTEF